MPAMDSSVLVLLGITFFAAFVNGSLGYGRRAAYAAA